MKQPLPEKFGKFEVVREIGKGGFGVVYEGRDPVLKRRVAIKTCSADDASMRQRFQREAEIVASLQHPNITTVHDLGVEDGVPYLVQEYLSGQDLSHFIIHKKDLPILRRIDILRSVARGLEHAHKRGIVHRDVKPGNVRVLENGTVKVMDFGIAKLTSGSETQLTQSGMMIGTAAYLAPEQVSDIEVDHRCDIFSFGVVAYELLTFQRPFAGTTISALLYKINHEEHTPLRANLPSAPAALSSLIDDCLAKHPNGRPISFTKVLERLDEVETALGGITRSAPAAAGPEDATRLAGGHRPQAGADSMDLAAAATMVTPSTAVDPTAKTTLTPSDVDPASLADQQTRIEPTTAERRVSDSAMSKMFSNASKPSMIAVAVFAVIAAVAVWFALSRAEGTSTPGSSDGSRANPTRVAAVGEPNAGASGEATTPSAAATGSTQSATVDAREPEAPPTSNRSSVAPAPSSAGGRGAAGGSAAHATERAADRAPGEPERPTQRQSEPAPDRRAPAETFAAPATRPAASSAEAVETAASHAPREPSTRGTGGDVDRPAGAGGSSSTQVPSSVSTPAATTASATASARPEPTARPASTTPVPAPPVAAPVDHRPALQAVLSVYRAAMENQDGGALQRIWPTLTRRQLERIEASFAATEAMEIEIGDCRFDIDVPSATADCRVERTITPRAGRRQSNTSRSTFSFRHENGSWMLTGV